MDPDPVNQVFEQREVLLNKIDLSIDAQNLKYQNMQYMNVIEAGQGKSVEVKFHKGLQTSNIGNKL